ncbi:hypothetical protein NVP1031O_151 [Vibrio phage 1.031.O._10N.261.46.F8]|nr:hypothetical protein NVP1031O_151 [Vibrio phage 1.031.O._10N.261.46.F8]
MDAIVNRPFEGTIRIPGSTSDTLVTRILRHDDTSYVTGLTVTSREGGYHFIYTFTEVGEFKIGIMDDDGFEQFVSLTTHELYASAEQLDTARDAIIGQSVIIKETSVYIKQTLTADFVAGSATNFRLEATMNGSATPTEVDQLSGTWYEGVVKNFNTGNFDSSAVIGDIHTFHNGVFSIIANTNDIETGQGQITDADKQWLISDLYHEQMELSISTSSREDFSIRNYQVALSEDSHYFLVYGDIYRTASSFGSIGGSDVLIGSFSGDAPVDHAYAQYTITKSSDGTTLVGKYDMIPGASRDDVTRGIHLAIIEEVNNHATIGGGIDWTYDAANTRINTHQPFVSMYTITMTHHNTDGTGSLGTLTLERVETTAIPSSGLSEEERTRLWETLSQEELDSAVAPLAKEDSILKLNTPWLT